MPEHTGSSHPFCQFDRGKRTGPGESPGSLPPWGDLFCCPPGLEKCGVTTSLSPSHCSLQWRRVPESGRLLWLCSSVTRHFPATRLTGGPEFCFGLGAYQTSRPAVVGGRRLELSLLLHIRLLKEEVSNLSLFHCWCRPSLPEGMGAGRPQHRDEAQPFLLALLHKVWAADLQCRHPQSLLETSPLAGPDLPSPQPYLATGAPRIHAHNECVRSLVQSPKLGSKEDGPGSRCRDGCRFSVKRENLYQEEEFKARKDSGVCRFWALLVATPLASASPQNLLHSFCTFVLLLDTKGSLK